MRCSPAIRFVGCGALSETTCQILADVLGRNVETVENPQNVGAAGAAAVIAVGLKLIPALVEVKEMIPISRSFSPNSENRPIYDRNFDIFKRLYYSNRKNFARLNSGKS